MIECVITKTVQAWDETLHTWRTGTLKECGNRAVVEPKGLSYTFDSENKIIWIIKKVEG